MIVGGDAAELGSGPGSYDIRRSVWHVNVSLVQLMTREGQTDNIFSAATRTLTAEGSGAYSTHYWAGRTLPQSGPLCHTTFTGSL